jgi:hypothetical protein
MDEIDKNFGKPNPNAPAALSQFAFLIGRWRCEATITLASGESQKYEAAWIGRYILDGYVIADEYGMAIPAGETPAGETIVLGMNFRAYDSARQQWNIKWLNALTGTWTDLGPEELGGVRFDGQSIFYVFKEPQATHLTPAPPTPTSLSRTSPGEAKSPATERPGPSSWSLRPFASQIN